MKIDSLKNSKYISLAASIILILFLIGAAFAFFQAQVGSGVSITASISSKTTDTLTFSKGADLSIGPLTETNFTSGSGNASSSTTATATLRANNNTNTATYGYNVYLRISANTLVKTTENAEMILTVTDPTGNPVTSITGLTYTTVKGVSGFDITEKKGLVTIASNYSITATNALANNTKTDTWNITLTFINLDTDQEDNMNKSFSAKILMQKEGAINYNFANYIKNSYGTDSNLYYMGTESGATYLNGEGSYTSYMPGDKSYRFSGGDYKVTQQAINAGYNYVNTSYDYSNDSSTTDGIIGINCNGTNTYVGNDCSTPRYYYLLYDTNVTQYSTYDAAVNQAISDGYLTNVVNNNYVCFGYDTSIAANATTCPEDNLYRIMGIFDDDNDGNYNVKLIKASSASTTEFGTNEQNGTSAYYGTFDISDYLGTVNKSAVDLFRWTGTSSYYNRWDNSTLRSDVLNGYYLNTYLGNTWKSKMIEATFYLGGPGNSGFNDWSAKGYYTAERSSSSVWDSTYPASLNNYVGLMYGSDYLYALEPSIWSLLPYYDYYNSIVGKNWLFTGVSERILTPRFYADTSVCEIAGEAEIYGEDADIGYSMRPVFYLNSSIVLDDGAGTKTDPYRIAL